ncbi:hypothetical protein, partial [Vallitalea okinawensis]|uniref:hypothetical protein n=1 Tax=Vallitalea okinawensis TaxID=2078660 RepID=UPI001A9A5D53
MRRKIIIIGISSIFALVLMSGGYGRWKKELIIEGDITVLHQQPQIIDPLALLTEELVDDTIIQVAGEGISEPGDPAVEEAATEDPAVEEAVTEDPAVE